MNTSIKIIVVTDLKRKIVPEECGIMKVFNRYENSKPEGQ
jgi:hypothetical protein